MTNKIAIIGSGSMGTALAKVLYDSGTKDIVIYGNDESEVKHLKEGKNPRYYNNGEVLPHFNTTTNLKEAVQDKTMIVFAIPSKAFGQVYPELLSYLNSEVIIVNGSKGFYPDTEKSLHEGLIDYKNNWVKSVVSIIGPSHAEEMVKELPTVVAAVSHNKEDAKLVQNIFTNDYFRVYYQCDVTGAEVGAAYKNVLAIVAGISAGLGYGVNTNAALITRGFAEMCRFNEVAGGKLETLFGLTGLGDLVVTATSDLSRNYTFGKMYATNKDKAIEAGLTVEGLTAAKHIYKIGKANNLDLPLAYSLYEIMYENKSIEKIFDSIWSRKAKGE